MKMDGDLGSIEPGKIADVVLVDGDPTARISDLRRAVDRREGGVVTTGRWKFTGRSG